MTGDPTDINQGTQGASVRIYKLVRGEGMGGLMCPPGHWNHRWSLEEYRTARSRTVIGAGTIELALDPDSGACDAIRDRVRRIMDESTLVCSELWVREVYGYFRGCYAPDTDTSDVAQMITFDNLLRKYIAEAGVPRDASDEQRAEVRSQATARARTELAAIPVERHLAVMRVRAYFPDHEPRLDLISDPGKGYGNYPCVKCDRRVQYEARLDKRAVVSTSHRPRSAAGWAEAATCTDGGSHMIEGDE